MSKFSGHVCVIFIFCFLWFWFFNLDFFSFYDYLQIVYILDQVRALETEMIQRIKKQGLNIRPRILIVCSSNFIDFSFCLFM